MKIGVYSNPNKDIRGSVKDAVLAAAKTAGMTAELYTSGVKYDFVVTIGGDGTILRIVKDCVMSETPVLGVNLGNVGFLTEIEPSDIENALQKLLRRDYMLERRALIDAEINGKHHYALNDVVIRAIDCHMIGMQVRVNDEVIDKFTCDGYIACTPTGSTAYSLSAGGSVIGPNTPVIALTPINPHTLRTRPVIVGSFEQVSLENSGATAAAVYVDGEQGADLAAGGKINITGWDRSALFVRFNKKNFYSRLLDKLNRWSASED